LSSSRCPPIKINTRPFRTFPPIHASSGSSVRSSGVGIVRGKRGIAVACKPAAAPSAFSHPRPDGRSGDPGFRQPLSVSPSSCRYSVPSPGTQCRRSSLQCPRRERPRFREKAPRRSWRRQARNQTHQEINPAGIGREASYSSSSSCSSSG
jgi:hypothetical protein